MVYEQKPLYKSFNSFIVLPPPHHHLFWPFHLFVFFQDFLMTFQLQYTWECPKQESNKRQMKQSNKKQYNLQKLIE